MTPTLLPHPDPDQFETPCHNCSQNVFNAEAFTVDLLPHNFKSVFSSVYSYFNRVQRLKRETFPVCSFSRSFNTTLVFCISSLLSAIKVCFKWLKAHFQLRRFRLIGKDKIDFSGFWLLSAFSRGWISNCYRFLFVVTDVKLGRSRRQRMK